MIKVYLEPANLHAGFAELCCLCFTETRHWYARENVPCCEDCAATADPLQMPTAMECARRTQMVLDSAWLERMENEMEEVAIVMP